MDSMSARLREARIAAGFDSARSAATKFGWGVSTYAAHENGQNGLPAKSAAVYAKAFKTTAAWLLTGDGAPPKRKNVVSSYDPDAPEIPSDPDATAASLFPSDAIRELASKAGMGAGQTIASSYVRNGDEHIQRDSILDDYWRLPSDFVRGDLQTSVTNLLIVNCKGDSMEPTLRAGERLIVDTSDKIPSGDRIFAIRDPLGEIIVKRLRLLREDPIRIQIVSDNPAVENRVEAFEDVAIVGRVVAGLKKY